MKFFKLSLFIFLFTISPNIFSQKLTESELPQALVNSYKKVHPDAHAYQWKWKEKENRYKTKFVQNGSKYKAYFAKDGSWIRTERDIKKTEVPEAVWEAFSKTEYVRWKIDDIEEHSTPQHKLVYEIEVKLKEGRQKRKSYLYYLPNGELTDVVVKK